MPALMRGMINSAPVPDGPGRWLAGQIVSAGPENEPMGFGQLPVNDLGSFTVDQVNNNPSEPEIYSAITLLDDGTVTKGAAPVDVVAGDVIIWMPFYLPDGELDPTGWRFVNNGQITLVPNTFFHIRIKDKTPEEVNIYLEAYNKKLEYTSDQFDPATDNRRFTTTNIRVSASGNNGFTTQGINDAIATWNTNHPSNTVVLNDTDNLTFFQCDGIMPVELFDEWKDNTQEVALADYYARRRWYITQQGLDALANNNYVINGTAAEVSQYLRDGLLD